MPEKDEHIAAKEPENVPSDEHTLTKNKNGIRAGEKTSMSKGASEPSQQELTLTAGQRQETTPTQVTFTVRQREGVEQSRMTFTAGRTNEGTQTGRTGVFSGKRPLADMTLSRSIGGGTGELVDKLNWEIGDVIDGRFEVKEIIGQGGMGIVYRIYHREWKLDMAVKMPLEYLVADEASKARFIREAQTWVDLGLHPNIVQCWYVRELGGVPRVFMDYIGGGSLKDWINLGKVTPGQWDKILDLVIQACDGLGYAHERGVEVHRDVKPGNMLLTESGDLLVTDFGIVKREGMADIPTPKTKTAKNDTAVAITMTGSELGTPEYGAPEQWGQARYADSRADIYGLGVILFEMCCGRRPYDDGSHSEPAHVIIGRHLSSPVPDPLTFNQNIPRPLAQVILKCLAKDPEKRPGKMLDLRQELAEIYRDIVGKHYRRMVPQAADLRSDALNNRAVSLLDLDKEPEAFESWNEALKLDAYHPESVYNKHLILWRKAQITDDDVVRQVEEAKHVSKRSNLYLGFLHLERTAADEAEEELLTALEDSELAQNGALWRALGDARLTQEKYTDAEETYQKALELIPGDSECLERYILAQSHTRIHSGQIFFQWQRCFRSFQSGHQGEVTAITVTSDGRYAVSAGEDKTLHLWDLVTHEWIRSLRGHEDKVLTVSVTLDGQIAVSGSRDKTLRVWELKTGKYLRTLRGHTDWVNVVAILPNGRHVVSGSRDKTLRLWDLMTGNCLWTSEKFKNWLNALAITPDGRYALTGHDEENLYLWDLTTGKLTERKYYGSSLEVLGFYWSAVSALTISPDGQFALDGNQNALMRVWDMKSGQVLRTLKAHDESVTSIAFTPNGRFAISGSEDTNLCLWDLEKNQPVWMFEGHHAGVTGTSVTPDGRLMVSGSRDGTVRIWDLEKHELVWTFWEEQGHKDAITSLALALNGRFVVSAGQDMTLRMWDFKTGRCLKTYQGHGKDVTTVAVTPDGRFALSGSRDATLALWELGTTKCLRIFSGHQKDVTSVSISPDGRLAVSASEDHTLRLWELETARCLQTYQDHQDGVTSVAMSPDGRFMISGSRDQTVRLWNLTTGKCVKIYEGHRGEIRAVAITSDGRFVVSAGADSTLRLWYLSTGSCLRVFEGHRERINAVTFTPDRNFIVSGSDDGTVRLWDFTTTKCLRTFKGHHDAVTALMVSSEGQFVVSGSRDATIRVWNLDLPEAYHYEAALQLCRQQNHEQLQWSADRFRKRMAWAKTAWRNGKATVAYRYLAQARSIPGYERAPEALKLNALIAKVLQRSTLRGDWLLWTGEEHHKGVTSVAVTPDGRLAISGSQDTTLRLWDIETGKCLRLFDGHWLAVTSVAITPDARFVISGSEDAALRLWDLASAHCLRVYEGHEQEVTAVTMSNYGRFILSGSKDGTVRLWNPSTTECLQILKGHRRGVTSVTMTPDRRIVISASDDRTIRFWERTSGKCLRVLKGHKQRVTEVLVTPDGRFLLSASGDQTLRLWRISTAKCLLVLKGHDHEITSITITTDGRFALSGSLDKTVKLWDLARGECLWTFKWHKQGVSAVAITPDGRFVLSGSEDHSVRLCELDWELDTSGTSLAVGENEQHDAHFLSSLTSLFKSRKRNG
ncbi:serine/threonine protein kinase with WD40 repeats [Candidatus Vecturithrix granuli]|uniref:Serine/threonine protein kinase with WD40 repeats n=1 Tax=Vecturithrix granuli TaxID=1499967 RepID=A0A081BXG4_VECG1|nr:serine/threonine protein kinase with WD40 repeats [Candidatus Vecturithrix granuli]